MLTTLQRNDDMDFKEGEIIAIDKPYRMSSFGALAHVRFLLSKSLGMKRLKTGHAGTLDPLATGVLLLCTGKATKRIEELQGHSKEYLATLQLGATTASFDKEHTVDATYPTAHIDKKLIEETLHRFEGDIMQTPPAYSACKINGKRAYKLKRKGDVVELQPKPIHVEQIELLSFDPKLMQLTIRVECGKGTYIRSLARDIGEALGSGAFLTMLRRTRVGSYTIDDCLDFDHLQEWIDRNVEAVGNSL